MSTSVMTKHWAVCAPDGTVLYEKNTRAHIYWSREAARAAMQSAEIEHKLKTHVDPVQIEDFRRG